MSKDGNKYCVLFTRVTKQWKVAEAIRRGFPEGRGEVFCPCSELWWNGSDTTVIRPVFPGYIFIRSDMGREELHRIIRSNKREIMTFVRELGFVSDTDHDNAEFTDLTDDETEFMDFLFGNDGILHMSYGYRDPKGRLTVMEGPLKGYEDHITDVNARQRKAYLDVSIRGHLVKAGLTIMPMRHWFPEDESAPVMLSDGREVKLDDIAAKMMGSSVK